MKRPIVTEFVVCNGSLAFCLEWMTVKLFATCALRGDGKAHMKTCGMFDF